MNTSKGSGMKNAGIVGVKVGVGLRVKLSRGIKLCKLRGRFLARVNNVNYKNFARARDLDKSRACFFVTTTQRR